MRLDISVRFDQNGTRWAIIIPVFFSVIDIGRVIFLNVFNDYF